MKVQAQQLLRDVPGCGEKLVTEGREQDTHPGQGGAVIGPDTGKGVEERRLEPGLTSYKSNTAPWGHGRWMCVDSSQSGFICPPSLSPGSTAIPLVPTSHGLDPTP